MTFKSRKYGKPYWLFMTRRIKVMDIHMPEGIKAWLKLNINWPSQTLHNIYIMPTGNSDVCVDN